MTFAAAKLGKLARLLFQRPGEFRDRVLTIVEFQADRVRRRPALITLPLDVLLQQLSERTGIQMASYFSEPALQEIEDRVKHLNAAYKKDSFHNATPGLARFCYAVCRALQPEVVLETGVGYGVTSAYLLQALAVNGKGRLWSIDLPPLEADARRQSGMLVPAELRERWEIRRGRVRDLLPKVLAELPPVDLFLHDSLHTYRNMTFEFQTAWPRLRYGGVLLSDDVGMNSAFEDFYSSGSPAFSAVEQAAFFGIAVKKSHAS